MSWSCFRTGRLLERRALGLNEAERLRLEQHLVTCSTCRSDSELLARLASLSDRAALEARASAPHERLIARAMLRASQPRKVPDSSAPIWPNRQRAALALLCALLLVAAFCGSALSRFVRARPSVARTAASPAPVSAPRSASVLAGDVFSGERKLRAGSALPEHTELTLTASSEIAVAHARVRSAARAAVSWDGAHSLELEHGAIDVSVDPIPKQPFSVQTERFRVEVMGTEFHVAETGVRVSRGRVRVFTRGGELLAELVAGQEFELPLAPSASASTSTSTADGGGSASAARGSDCQERLSLARRDLSSGDSQRARSEISAALALHPSASQQAEAHMLLGDAARIAGDEATASSEYLGVFGRFSALPVAEPALFSAARLERRAGHTARARELFRSYLKRYPNGQFRSEALQAASALAGAL